MLSRISGFPARPQADSEQRPASSLPPAETAHGSSPVRVVSASERTQGQHQKDVGGIFERLGAPPAPGTRMVVRSDSLQQLEVVTQGLPDDILAGEHNQPLGDEARNALDVLQQLAPHLQDPIQAVLRYDNRLRRQSTNTVRSSGSQPNLARTGGSGGGMPRIPEEEGGDHAARGFRRWFYKVRNSDHFPQSYLSVMILTGLTAIAYQTATTLLRGVRAALKEGSPDRLYISSQILWPVSVMHFVYTLYLLRNRYDKLCGPTVMEQHLALLQQRWNEHKSARVQSGNIGRAPRTTPAGARSQLPI